MKQPYSTPAVVDYGSIADNTFVTPATVNKFPGVTITEMPKLSDGNFQCRTDAGLYANGGGGKNYIVLQCDKYGEFSHS